MKSLPRLLLVILFFSVLFFALRTYGGYIGYDIPTLISDLGGITYLYATVGTIFAIFAAFIIMSESQDWTTLSAAAKDEIRDLNELLLWSGKLSEDLANRFSKNIDQYLDVVVSDEWEALSRGIESSMINSVILKFHDLVYDAAKEDVEIGGHLFVVFGEFLNHRDIRVAYSWQPLPIILKFTVALVALSVTGLSFFIGVRNAWLDYIFLLCIVTLVAVIITVIDDLDNPLRPGDWCLRSDGYKVLLRRLRQFKRPPKL